MDLVSLKHVGLMDQYHDSFISLLNQLHLLEPYALKMEGFWTSRQAEAILNGSSKHGLLTGWGVQPKGTPPSSLNSNTHKVLLLSPPSSVGSMQGD